MSAIAGIKAELKSVREARVGAAQNLDESHKEYMEVRSRFHRDQASVEHMNDRIESLVKALREVGGSDD